MKKLLYLVHRLPYPPNKGDKISSYNMLKFFSSEWRVHLGTFVDDHDDWQHVETVKEYCEDACIEGLTKTQKITGSLQGLATGKALSLSYYSNEKLQNWVRQSIEREKPDAVLIFSGAMGQFVRGLLPSDVPVIFDAEDVDSEKWRGYARTKAWPLSSLYSREANKLLEFERDMATHTSASIFVSQDEAELFKRLAPESAHKIFFRTQGVDSDYFDPGLEFDNPYEKNQKVLVFTGAMDYWPNIDSVSWFAEEILPGIAKVMPDALFCIVGMKPSEEVRRLDKLPNIRVTGGVPDVRPYLQHALCSCLPLRLAHGIQNKALEAMSMELPVLATTAAITGIGNYQQSLTYVADDPGQLQQLALDLLSKPRQLNTAGRDCVLENYNWQANLKKMEAFMLPANEDTP